MTSLLNWIRGVIDSLIGTKEEPVTDTEVAAPYVLELNLAPMGSSERIQQLKELRIEVQRMVEDASIARRSERFI